MLGLSSYTVDQVRNMSLQEYTNAVATDLLRGESLGEVFGESDTNFQIKSATDNVGTFSSETNDIRYQTAVNEIQRQTQKVETLK